METLITATIISHMESNQYLSNSQYGCRKGRSTTSLLLKSINDHITCLDNECNVDVMYQDSAKAFDSVDHALLLQKLSWYNLQLNIICWISNFLSGRSQKFRLGNVCSNCIPVLSGVVQGSSVGVTLFLIFINDLPLCIKLSKLYLFADDPKLSHSISFPEDVCLLQSDLDSIYQLSSKWKLPVNATKLTHMHLSFRFQPENYNFNGHSISLVHSFKDFDVTIDDKLTFREHIKNVLATAHRLCAVTYNAFSTRQPQFLARVFTAYIRPKLEYAAPYGHPI